MFIKVMSSTLEDRFILEAPAIELLEQPPAGDLIDWTMYDEQSILIEAGDARMFVPVQDGDVVIIVATGGEIIYNKQVELRP